MRVIAGKYKSRKIMRPNSSLVRPTKDIVKEAIFSMIQSKIDGAIVLDLFSGSGALSIESISRGAMKSYAIDNNQKAINCIKRNLKELNIENIVVVKQDAINFLKHKIGNKYRIIFLDPPYNEGDLYNFALREIAKNDLLENLGIIILEIENYDFLEIPEILAIQKVKRYGKTKILIISKNI